MKKFMMVLVIGALLTGCNNSKDMGRKMSRDLKMYFDIHNTGQGKVTANAVAQAYKKDLMVQDKYQVSFLNYWVDEKNGYVYCQSESHSPKAVVKTHTEAHGLIPQTVMEVTQGK